MTGNTVLDLRGVAAEVTRKTPTLCRLVTAINGYRRHTKLQMRSEFDLART